MGGGGGGGGGGGNKIMIKDRSPLMSLQSCANMLLESSHECNSSTVMLVLNCRVAPTEAPVNTHKCKIHYMLSIQF